jgi:phosphoribosyl-ATP pyrophosphohydrolase/phosphoribosyl-AMP cyclohydrolase
MRREGEKSEQASGRVSIPEEIAYDAAGLVPVIVQDRRSGDVLMVAYANAEAVARSVETGLAHFWSRRRQALWQKGETSGAFLRVHRLLKDCDGDVLLMLVEPQGNVCHTGQRTCFGDDSVTAAGVLEELMRVIGARLAARPADSYTARLAAKGEDHVLKKIGEEATEVILAAKGEGDERLAEETADLLFHLLVLLGGRGLRLETVLDVLRGRRRGK